MARRTGFPRRPRSDDLTADVLYDQYGRDFAADLRAGVAPNQREDDMLPPCAILNATGRQKDDGTPEFKAGKRYMGATGMVLRRDCAQRDSPDSRYGTLNGAARLKEALGEQGRALRGRNPVTGDRPQPVQVRSNFASQVQSVHQQDGEGYNARGELGPVKKGDPIYDEDRNRAPDTYEARRTYPAYHLSDFDIQNMPERSQPMSRDWAIEEGNRRFAEKCKAAGAEVREPDDEERAICNIEYAMDRVLDKEAARGTVVNRDVEDLKKIEFSVGPEGEATLSVPKDEAFADVHEKYTQLAVASAHAHLYREAHARAQCLPPAGKVALRVALRYAVELGLPVAGLELCRPDGLDPVQELLSTIHRAPFGRRFLLDDHQLARRASARLQLVAESDDGACDRRGPRQRLQHREPAAFDAPGNFHLPVPREQRHRAHLAQVHPDRVARLVDRAGREIELGLVAALRPSLQAFLFLVLVLGLDDLYAGVAERVEQLVELLGRSDLGRKQVVDLVEEEITAFLADDDQLLDLVVALLDRQLLARHPVTSCARLAVADRCATRGSGRRETRHAGDCIWRRRIVLGAAESAVVRAQGTAGGHSSCSSMRCRSSFLRAQRASIASRASGEPSRWRLSMASCSASSSRW